MVSHHKKNMICPGECNIAHNWGESCREKINTIERSMNGLVNVRLWVFNERFYLKLLKW